MRLVSAANSVFGSFWAGGYEGADHINGRGVPLAMAERNQHCSFAAEDYGLLSSLGFKTVRESVGWRLVDRGRDRWDFSALEKRVRAAQAQNVQIIWTLWHYGCPARVDLFSDDWIDDFAAYCRRVVEFIASFGGGVPIYAPINEISFMAWAVCETRLMHPYAGERAADAYSLKKRLVRAAIAACDAIWDVEPRARILQVDPLIHVVAPAAQLELAESAQQYCGFQFQAWDMLAGVAEPELGGAPRYLDLVGVNYYADNQWEYSTGNKLEWHARDPRRKPLSALLDAVHERYRRPVYVAETSHVGAGRGQWIREVADEVGAALERGLPIEGICIYPIIDRPDWEDGERWHNSGLWDLESNAAGVLERRIASSYADDLQIAQQRIAHSLARRNAPEKDYACRI
jgi:UDP-galactopyranose mutase